MPIAGNGFLIVPLKIELPSLSLSLALLLCPSFAPASGFPHPQQSRDCLWEGACSRRGTRRWAGLATPEKIHPFDSQGQED